MKKLVLVLAMALIAAPSFALTLGLVDNGNDTVSLTYSGASTANLPRAFALTVTIDGGAQITAVTPAITGVSTAASKGFGIFPGTIDINSSGIVQTYGSPLALDGDPGALDQTLPSSGFVIELGSLYAPRTSGVDANEPATSGTLATFAVDCGIATGNVNIAVAEEETYRGGVVLEDGTVPSPALTASLVYSCGCTMPGAATLTSPANGASVSNASQTLTWTAGSAATGYDVYFGTVTPPVTKVSSNQAGLTYATGALTRSKTYYWRVDSVNACGTTAGTAQNFITKCFPSTNAKYADWIAVGQPNCWCANIQPRQCKGDADGKSETKSNFWTSVNDLTVLKAAWNRNYASIAGQTAGLYATPLICADFDHASETKSLFRVSVNDLTILKANWNKVNLPNATDCLTAGN